MTWDHSCNLDFLEKEKMALWVCEPSGVILSHQAAPFFVEEKRNVKLFNPSRNSTDHVPVLNFFFSRDPNFRGFPCLAGITFNTRAKKCTDTWDD